MYSQKIMQRFVNPRNAGSIKKPDASAKVIDETNADVFKFYLKVNQDTFVIEDASFKTFGSPVAIACSDIACDMLKGKHIDVAENITNTDIVNYVGDNEIPVEKISCATTITEAIKGTIKIFRKKYILN